MNKLDYRDIFQCAQSCLIFWRKPLLLTQNEHFTTTVFSKHSSGHEGLAEPMQDGPTTRTAQSWGTLPQPGASFSSCSGCQAGLYTSPRCPSSILIVFDARRWWLSVHLFLSQVCCLPVKEVGKLPSLKQPSQSHDTPALLFVLLIRGSPGQQLQYSRRFGADRPANSLCGSTECF